jgi:hypothetical protein
MAHISHFSFFLMYLTFRRTFCSKCGDPLRWPHATLYPEKLAGALDPRRNSVSLIIKSSAEIERIPKNNMASYKKGSNMIFSYVLQIKARTYKHPNKSTSLETGAIIFTILLQCVSVSVGAGLRTGWQENRSSIPRRYRNFSLRHLVHTGSEVRISSYLMDIGTCVPWVLMSTEAWSWPITFS